MFPLKRNVLLANPTATKTREKLKHLGNRLTRDDAI